jgi:uncharacterized membrane protein
MAIPVERSAANGLLSAQDVAAPPSAAFQLICEVEKWPVWLSFLRSARRLDPRRPLGLGSELAIRSAIPGDEEEFFEVDRFIEGHLVSLVGWYSVRRRIDMRVERKSDRSKVVVRVDYPTYGGVLGALVDRLTVRRKLETALEESLIHFKGLVEYERGPDALLADL